MKEGLHEQEDRLGVGWLAELTLCAGQPIDIILLVSIILNILTFFNYNHVFKVLTYYLYIIIIIIIITSSPLPNPS